MDIREIQLYTASAMADSANPENPLIPEWIQREQIRRESERARAEAESATERAAGLLIKANSPLFAKDVLRIVKLSVDALPTLGINGSINSVGVAFRVCINKLGRVATFTYTDIFFEPFGIRCNVFGGGSYALRYCAVSESEIGVIDDAEPMDREQTAEYILTRMMRRLEKPIDLTGILL